MFFINNISINTCSSVAKVAATKTNGLYIGGLDGIGNGLGYTIILLTIGTIREIFGSGKFLGFQVIPDAVYNIGYANNGLMVLPISSIILIGVIIWFQRGFNKKLVDVS